VSETALVRAVTFWVECKLVNQKNQRAARWQIQHGRTARLRKAAEQAAGLARIGTGGQWRQDPASPKRVTFTAYVWNRFDDDSLPVTMAPIRDALMTARFIHSDAPTTRHVFSYAQILSRERRGVEITVEALL